MKVSYQWLQEYLGEDIPNAQALADLLTFHAFEIESVEEVGNDWVIDVDVLPNRSSDCLCHRGIARELATLLDRSLAHDPLANVPDLSSTESIKVSISDPSLCPRFTALHLSGVKIGESPDWLKARLATIGQRSINNIVDATNYVMYALGQPLHAYDAELFPRVNGRWHFGVRTAQPGETISLLAEGGKEEERIIELVGTETLIIDKSSDTPIGLAGVKGGRFAGVHADTTEIIIEAAHFDPIKTRNTARRLGIVIDASKRFENEPSRELPPYAQAEILKLITDIAGGQFAGYLDSYLVKQTPVTVSVSVTEANSLLGLRLTALEMQTILERAGITTECQGDTLTCTGPFERTDLTIAEDFIEEIGRIYGYDKVAAVVPEYVPLTEINARHFYSEQVRACLLEQGFSEVITSSFQKKATIQLKNALAADKSFVRSSLSKNITAALDLNAGRADLFGTADTRVFEIGTVFAQGGEFGVTEHMSLCLGVRIRSSGYSGKEDAVLAEALTALEAELGMSLTATIEKGVAEIHFTELVDLLPLPSTYHPVSKPADISYQPFSLYPHVTRDIAMWVSEGVDQATAETVLKAAAGDLCVRTTFVDEFSKDGKTSLAFRLVFQASDRTLTDSEVNKIMDAIHSVVAEKEWEVR